MESGRFDPGVFGANVKCRPPDGGDEDPSLARRLYPDLPYITAEVVWAVRGEMARTVEDVVARRTRALFLNARASHAPVAWLPSTA